MSDIEIRYKKANTTVTSETWIGSIKEAYPEKAEKFHKEYNDYLTKALGVEIDHILPKDWSRHTIPNNLVYVRPPSANDTRENVTGNSSSPHRSRDLMMQIVDLILEPDEAEEAMGDLEEGYALRHTKNKGHAVRWVWAQTLRIAVNRTFDLIRQYARAKTGK